MLRLNRLCLPLLSVTLLLSSSAHAASAAEPSAALHSEDTAAIRRHHINKLTERLSTDEETLKQSCRFESEISLAPPPKQIALTFDDGPEPLQTEFILTILKKYQIPATFFMIGEKVRAHPELLKLVQDSGYGVIGQHSWSHPNFHDISTDQQSEEILKNYAETKAFNTAQLFRYPYGNSTCAANQLLKSINQHIIGWHVDSCDWAFERKGSVDLKEALSCGVSAQNRSNYQEHVISAVHAHNGGIVLMHEIHPSTLKQIDDIIRRLLEEGYVFKSLAEPSFEKYFR
ncbi:MULTISPECIES: polysaccharide deacetylase family protein [unclassified Undibacterium]|uniref:polysaccharide deacetylase family protein n=1 Tax=unclassified Undibacterium TaxID=2630295 RepID=UPI002AC8B6E5|nr:MULTISPECIES: polysaccharide deacetylase family protein [unclassified Undibacterium]MEB0140105.1 polysaccharide deacetylase family protein [Undibacterium sp. CCC2.1]MEB0173215.1 polysaccharide deacetylase family protein [Undibacterium sp. CCC1.1]MEB0176924.1 polysaccharide deacetylase family protein [Undibacterium sp. CCC3.4]MEB0216257.1 polysaccharide deacetylase family protein [Undibacterium sp. 5I2]WPX44161.1 polysaccharide deacetylase family protein [Undibacterium sp. CCC3.4]